MGRLVGYVELQKGPTNKTDLDVPPAFKNDVLRSKKVLIGCGGGYHQECSQSYFFLFFLQCRIAQDSCGHVPANSRTLGQKENALSHTARLLNGLKRQTLLSTMRDNSMVTQMKDLQLHISQVHHCLVR